MKIIVVVVTYNRSKWLIECLRSLLQQTRKVDSIIVVDNNSTDDTKEQLNKFVTENHHKQWCLEYLDDNTGGAGGFAYGMEKAFSLAADYVWVMDDDVEAFPNALEDLLMFSDKASILHGRRKNPDGSYFYWQHKFFPWIGFSFPYADTAFKESDVCFVNSTCFEGALIKREVIEQIGLPNQEYFLAWDDTEYGYKASEFFKIAYCNSDTFIRKKGDDSLDISVRKLASPSPLYQYYHIRNRFLLFKTVTSNVSIVKRMFMALTFHSFTVVLIIKEMARSALFKDWGLGFIPMMNGVYDGLLGKFGKNLR